MTNNICFATMATGDEYRELATLLARDLSEYCGSMKLVVLTDKPDYFTRFSNVTAYKHNPTGNWYCYHDKRFVISQALALYNICIFVDADCRLLNTPPLDEILALEQGIYGYDTSNLEHKIDREERATQPLNKGLSNTPSRRRQLHLEVSHITGINYSTVMYTQESLMIFVKNEQMKNYDVFFSAWNYIAGYLRVRRYEWGIGETIGLAANFSGIEIKPFSEVPSWLFKDLYKGDSLSNTTDKEDEIEKLMETRKQLSTDNKKNWLNKIIYYCKGGINYIFFAIWWSITNRRMRKNLSK